MPAYLVTLNQNIGGRTLTGGGDAMAVFAADATAAKEICSAQYDGDGSAWATDATVTELVQDADFNGWTFTVDVFDGLGAGGNEPGSVSVVGDATDTTVDEIAALLVTALNALTGIANASYNGTTNTLTIAGAADGLGDQSVQVQITPPNGKSPVASLVGTVTDGGASGDALTVVLPADAAVIPTVAKVLKQVE